MFGTERNDPFAQINSVSSRGARNPYLLDGQYHLRVEKCATLRSRDDKLFFIVELDILSSTNLERPEGLRVTWMTNLQRDMGPINTKRFLSAAMGIDPDSKQADEEITSDVARLAVGEDQPMKGMELYAQATTIQTKAGDPFLDVKWMPIVQTVE